MNPHFSQHELLEQVYGVGREDAHLRDCAECSQRLQLLLNKKARVTAAEIPVSNQFLASQRRAVYSRLDRAAASHVRWAPALAGAGLLAMGLFWFPRPELQAPRAPLPAAQVELSNNEQFFSEVYSMEQSVEPSAVAPMHSLFEPSGAGEQ
jgi:hypothetical protein